jgi:hypothetical protein
MSKKGKKIAILYWVLFIFNFFGFHRIYLEGRKSKMFWLYLFLNTAYLVLAFTWGGNYNKYNEIIQYLTIVIYIALLCLQIRDYQWINRFVLKLQKQEQLNTDQDSGSDNNVSEGEVMELTNANELRFGHEYSKSIILSGFAKKTRIKLKRKKPIKIKSGEQVNQSADQQKNVLQKKSGDRSHPTVTLNEHSVKSNNFSKGQNSIQPKEDQITQLVQLLKQSESGMTLSQVFANMEVNDKGLFETDLNLQITLKSTPIQQKQNSDGIVIYYLPSS